MKPRAFLAALLAAAAMAYAIAHLLSYRPVLMTNRAAWLLNQGRWDEAREQLLVVRERHPQFERAKRLLALVSLNTGQYEHAADEIRQLHDSAYRDFLHGAWAYAGSRDAEATRAFESLLNRPRKGLEPWMAELAALATGGNSKLALEARSGNVPEPGRLSPLERLLRNGFLARTLYEERRYKESRAFFESAWAARDRNRRTMIFGAVTHAFLGDYSRAQMYADRATSRTEFLSSVAQEAERISSETSASLSPTIQQAVHADESHLRLQRAAVWCAVAAGVTGGDDVVSRTLAATEEFLTSAPRDLIGRTFHGEALERAGRLREAYDLYSRAFSETPAYPLLLRMRDLVGNPEAGRLEEAEFLRGRQVIAYVSAEGMKTSGTVARGNHLAFYHPAAASVEFDVPEDGEYQIALIASGDRAFGLGPLVALTLDGRRTADIYIAREGWDVYPRRENLPHGHHRLHIEYTNDSERRLSDEEDRNFYLQGVLVTRAGGQE